MRPMVLTVKPKIPELSAKNQMVQHFSGNYIPKFRCTLFPAFETGSRKIVYYLIISSFSSILRVRGIKVTSAILIKKKIGKRFENDKRHPLPVGKTLIIIKRSPQPGLWAKLKKKRKFDL